MRYAGVEVLLRIIFSSRWVRNLFTCKPIRLYAEGAPNISPCADMRVNIVYPLWLIERSFSLCHTASLFQISWTRISSIKSDDGTKAEILKIKILRYTHSRKFLYACQRRPIVQQKHLHPDNQTASTMISSFKKHIGYRVYHQVLTGRLKKMGTVFLVELWYTNFQVLFLNTTFVIFPQSAFIIASQFSQCWCSISILPNISILLLFSPPLSLVNKFHLIPNLHGWSLH